MQQKAFQHIWVTSWRKSTRFYLWERKVSSGFRSTSRPASGLDPKGTSKSHARCPNRRNARKSDRRWCRKSSPLRWICSWHLHTRASYRPTSLLARSAETCVNMWNCQWRHELVWRVSAHRLRHVRETRVEGLFKSGAELDDVSARFVVKSAVGKHEVEVAKAVLHSRVTTIFQLRSDRSQIHRLLHHFEIILQ